MPTRPTIHTGVRAFPLSEGALVLQAGPEPLQLEGAAARLCSAEAEPSGTNRRHRSERV